MKTATPTLVVTPTLSLARFADYVALARPRIAVMVLITVVLGGLLASVGDPPIESLMHALLSTAIVTMAASALNQWAEADSDALMRRTADRPLPAGRLTSGEVLTIGIGLAVIGLAYQAATLPMAATAVTAFTLFSYVCVYTPAKRYTNLNTLIGAVPGALPPVIGWTAVRGQFDAGAAWLFLIVFFWQVPHFLAIAWLYRDEYARAGHKMLTVDDEDGSITARQMLLYLLALVPVSLLAAPTFNAGWSYAIGALVLAGYWLWPVLAFRRQRDRSSARAVLKASLVYLPGLLCLMLTAKYLPNF